jgi:hypothetical protein
MEAISRQLVFQRGVRCMRKPAFYKSACDKFVTAHHIFLRNPASTDHPPFHQSVTPARYDPDRINTLLLCRQNPTTVH